MNKEQKLTYGQIVDQVNPKVVIFSGFVGTHLFMLNGKMIQPTSILLNQMVK